MRHLFVIIILLSFVLPAANADHSPTHSRWSIEIIENDVILENLDISIQGNIVIPILIINENQISITISLNYSAPFEAEISGPESITVEGSSDKEFEVILSNINTIDYDGGENDEFEVTGTVTSRQGLPVSVPGDSDSTNVNIFIPEIQILDVEIDDILQPVNAGEDIILVTKLSNLGNVESTASEVSITTDCPLLNIDIKVTELANKAIKPKEEKSVDINLETPKDYPTKICDIEAEAIYEDSFGIQSSKDNTKISLIMIDEENNLVSEVVTENLSTPNIFILFIAILSATIASDKKIFHE